MEPPHALRPGLDTPITQAEIAASADLTHGWDTAYEFKAVALLALGFGLVGLDRFMILPMFPAIMKDLHLGYQNLGEITGALAVTWGIASLFAGRLSDRFGERRLVLVGIVAFSVLVGLSGLANGLLTLVLVRALMGVADGIYATPSIVATLQSSKPSRHGMNLGIEQMMLPLFGLALAPILVTQLLQAMNWRWIFVLVTPFGLLVAAAMVRVLRRSAPRVPVRRDTANTAGTARWTDVIRTRNIQHNMIGMLCWLICLVVTSALLPSYLTDYLHLSLPQMGFVLSAIGFGGRRRRRADADAVRPDRAQAGDADLHRLRRRLAAAADAAGSGAGAAVRAAAADQLLQLRPDHADGGPDQHGVGAAGADGLRVGAGDLHRRDLRRRHRAGHRRRRRRAVRHPVHPAAGGGRPGGRLLQ